MTGKHTKVDSFSDLNLQSHPFQNAAIKVISYPPNHDKPKKNQCLMLTQIPAVISNRKAPILSKGFVFIQMNKRGWIVTFRCLEKLEGTVEISGWSE